MPKSIKMLKRENTLTGLNSSNHSAGLALGDLTPPTRARGHTRKRRGRQLPCARCMQLHRLQDERWRFVHTNLQSWPITIVQNLLYRASFMPSRLGHRLYDRLKEYHYMVKVVNTASCNVHQYGEGRQDYKLHIEYEMISFSSLTTILENNLPTFRLDALLLKAN